MQRLTQKQLTWLVAGIAVAACHPDARSVSGPLAYLYAPPDGRFLHVSSTDTTGANRDFVEVPRRGQRGIAGSPGPRTHPPSLDHHRQP